MEDNKVIDELVIESNERTRIKEATGNDLSYSVATKERSLAKTTKILNRLKRFYADANLEALLADLMKLDLTSYMEELVSGLSEAFKGMKLRDSFRFVEICAHLHSCYRQFGVSTMNSLRRMFDQVSNDNLRLRVYLRVLSEFTLVGIIPKNTGVNELSEIFRGTLLSNSENSSIQISLVRLNAISFWVSRYSATDLLHEVEPLIKGFYTSHCLALIEKAKQEIVSQESANAKVRIDKGQVDQENENRYAGVKANFEKIESYVSLIRATLNYPQLSLESSLQDEIRLSSVSPTETPEEPLSPMELQFVDSTERSFYVDLLDLESRLPSALLSTDATTSTDNFDAFMNRFNQCNTREEADDLAIQWFESGFNSKGNRKRIVRAFTTGSVMTAFQCRFLANLFTICKDLSEPIISELFQRCRRSSREDQQSSIRLLGELTKFSVCPPGRMLDLLAQFINDFSPTSGESAAWVLVSCGRFLVNHPDAGTIADNLITRLIKTKNSIPALNAKVQMMIDDAYFQAKPRSVESNVCKETPIELYIKHLVQVEVYYMDEDELLRLIKRLPWSSDRAVAKAFKRYILDLSLASNFTKISNIASLLSGLIKFQEDVVVEIIDTLFEQFQVSLEREDFRQSPTRVRLAKLIGELYAFKLIDSNTVFDVLYHLIGFRDSSCYGAGDHTVLVALFNEHSLNLGSVSTIKEDDEESYASNNQIQHARSVDEPEWSFIRVVLVSTIIMSVGEFFIHGRNKSRMHRFLLLFRRYVLVRSSQIPRRIINIVHDLFDCLGVKGYKLTSDSVDKIDEELKSIVQDLSAARAAPVVDEQRETAEEGCSSSDSHHESVDEEELEEDDDHDNDSYNRGTLHEEDIDKAQFEKEMQALLVDSLAEAKGKRVQSDFLSQLVLSRHDSRASSSSDDDETRTVSLKFMSRSKGNAIGRSIIVPDDNKLLKGRLHYEAEQRAAARERQELKQYILDYERTANQAPKEGPPVAGKPVTLAQAAGIRSSKEFDELKWSNRRPQRNRK